MLPERATIYFWLLRRNFFLYFNTIKKSCKVRSLSSETDENGKQIEKESVAISFDMLNEYIKEQKTVYAKSASSDDESEKADYYDYVYRFPDSSNVNQEYKNMLVEYNLYGK